MEKVEEDIDGEKKIKRVKSSARSLKIWEYFRKKFTFFVNIEKFRIFALEINMLWS